MKLVYKDDFLKASLLLPKRIQNRLDELLTILTENPFHPYLHTKLLMGKFEKKYSFRITRDWRAIFLFLDRDTIQLLKVANRKDIYK